MPIALGLLYTDYISGMIESPQVKTYTLDPSVIDGRLLKTLVIYTSLGTCSVDIKISGISVTGMSGLSVNSTPQQVSATSLNNANPGDSITLVVNSEVSSSDLVFRIQYERI